MVKKIANSLASDTNEPPPPHPGRAFANLLDRIPDGSLEPLPTKATATDTQDVPPERIWVDAKSYCLCSRYPNPDGVKYVLASTVEGLAEALRAAQATLVTGLEEIAAGSQNRQTWERDVATVTLRNYHAARYEGKGQS